MDQRIIEVNKTILVYVNTSFSIGKDLKYSDILFYDIQI